MSVTTRAMLVVGIATVTFAAAGLAQLAGAQPAGIQREGIVTELGNNEGVFVNAKSFQISKGLAKGDATGAIARLGAREISPGAILFRVGEKLYLVEGKPPTTVGAAATKDFDESLTSMMKNFQDEWAVGYMK